jgi:hypothetical protein
LSHLQQREFVISLCVPAFDRDLVSVPDLYFFPCQRTQRQDALGLVSDIEKGRLGRKGDHRRFDLLVAIFRIATMRLLELREELTERLRVFAGFGVRSDGFYRGAFDALPFRRIDGDGFEDGWFGGGDFG